MKRGFISGIVLSLLVAFLTLGYASVSNAEGGRFPTHTIISSFTSSSGSSNPADKPDKPIAHYPTGTIKTNPIKSPAPTPSPTPAPTVSYAALGDSVASGVGLPAVDNATTQDTRCGRSSQAYPAEVARQLNLQLGFYACSGASSGDIYTRQWLSNYNPRIQIDQAFAQGKPKLITITIGANDMHWSQLITSCYNGTCGSATQTSLLKLRLGLLQQRLGYVLQQIKDRSQGTAPAVILTGYYNPISQGCAALFPDRITSQEVTWANNGVASLNQAIQQTTGIYGFASFAPVDFTGHDICSGAPWVQGLTDKSPIHPTAVGQQAIAKSVLATYRATH